MFARLSRPGSLEKYFKASLLTASRGDMMQSSARLSIFIVDAIVEVGSPVRFVIFETIQNLISYERNTEKFHRKGKNGERRTANILVSDESRSN